MARGTRAPAASGSQTCRVRRPTLRSTGRAGTRLIFGERLVAAPVTFNVRRTTTMRGLYAVAALLMLVSESAFADLAADLRRCATEKNSVTRLACYDKLAPQAAAQDPGRGSANISKWHVESETSPIDDSKNVVASIQANSPIIGWPGKRFTPALVIRCKERKTEAYLVTGMSPTVEYGTDTATVTFRLDKQPAFKVHANKSTDGEALFLPQPVALVKRLLEGHTLLFEFVPFNSSGQMTAFDLTGLTEAVKAVRDACRW